MIDPALSQISWAASHASSAHDGSGVQILCKAYNRFAFGLTRRTKADGGKHSLDPLWISAKAINRLVNLNSHFAVLADNFHSRAVVLHCACRLYRVLLTEAGRQGGL